MKKYVLVVVFKQRRQKVLLQLVDHGVFSGKLNCPSGRVGKDEWPAQVAYRKLYEETGLERTRLTPIVTQQLCNGIILYVFATELRTREDIRQSKNLEWFLLSHVASTLDPSLAEGVPYFVHLAKNILEVPAWPNSK